LVGMAALLFQGALRLGDRIPNHHPGRDPFKARGVTLVGLPKDLGAAPGVPRFQHPGGGLVSGSHSSDLGLRDGPSELSNRRKSGPVGVPGAPKDAAAEPHELLREEADLLADLCLLSLL
jgi:hypothetical protein